MTNLQVGEVSEKSEVDNLEMHKDILTVQWDFLRHLFKVLDPSTEIEELKNYRAANDDILLDKVA